MMTKWDKAIKEFTVKAEECSYYDWDGQGAAALEDGLYERVVSILQSFVWLDFPPPDGITVGVNGTVIVEWQKDREYFELEFSGKTIEGMCWRKGDQKQV